MKPMKIYPIRTNINGFTLIELMIAVAIVGILAAVALPNYVEYVRRGKIQEATSTLADARVKLEQFYMDNRDYSGGSGGWACGSTAPTGKYFTYTCTGASTTYTVTATGVGDMAGFVYTIDQANTRTSTITGWGSGSCWITKKGETC